MISCHDAKKYMSLYLDNMLDQQTELDFLQHIKTCKACALELETMRRIVHTLNESRVLPPDDFSDKLHQRLAQEALKPQKTAWQKVFGWRGYSVAAAAAVLLLVVKSNFYSTFLNMEHTQPLPQPAGNTATQPNTPSAEQPELSLPDAATAPADLQQPVLDETNENGSQSQTHRSPAPDTGASTNQSHQNAVDTNQSNNNPPAESANPPAVDNDVQQPAMESAPKSESVQQQQTTMPSDNSASAEAESNELLRSLPPKASDSENESAEDAQAASDMPMVAANGLDSADTTTGSTDKSGQSGGSGSSADSYGWAAAPAAFQMPVSVTVTGNVNEAATLIRTAAADSITFEADGQFELSLTKAAYDALIEQLRAAAFVVDAPELDLSDGALATVTILIASN